MTNLLQILSFIFLAAILSSCQIKSNHGRQIPDSEIHKLKTSPITKEEVAEQFGYPTLTSIYGQDSWYYISRKQYYRAFFAPQVSSQEIVQISFKGNKVDKVNLFENTENAIAPVREVTPTYGQNINFVSDFVSHLGKFHKKKKGR